MFRRVDVVCLCLVIHVVHVDEVCGSKWSNVLEVLDVDFIRPCGVVVFALFTGQVGLGVGSWPSNRATEGSNPKGTRLYFVILLACSGCMRCCNFCLICDACSWRCCLMGGVCVSSCRCCVFVFSDTCCTCW